MIIEEGCTTANGHLASELVDEAHCLPAVHGGEGHFPHLVLHASCLRR